MKYVLCLVLLPLLAYSTPIELVADPIKPIFTPEMLAQIRGKPIFTPELMVQIQKKNAEQLLKKHVQDLINKMKIRHELAKKTQQEGLKFLCTPCKTVFQDVKVELEDVEKITEPILESEINVS
jgi:hypothetical protein